MPRTSSKIRPGELKSVLRAVAGAGVKVTRIDIGENGSITMLTTEAQGTARIDVLDRELAEFEDRKHGDR